MEHIPYDLEINNSSDHNILCELLAKARKDYKAGKEEIIISMLLMMTNKLNEMSEEIAELKAALVADTPSSEESSAIIKTTNTKDDLYSVVNTDSSIHYSKKVCEDMEKCYIAFLLQESGIRNKNAILRAYLAPVASLRHLVEAPIDNLAKLKTIGRPTAKQLRAYLDEKFGKSERLFSPEIVQEIKKVYLQHIFIKNNIDQIIECYPSFEELAKVSKKELLFLSKRADVERFCAKLKARFDIEIRED